MAIALENNNIIKSYIGNTVINKVYAGDELLLGTELPKGYIELEYLQSDGLAYIDTKIRPTANMGFKLDFISGTNRNNWLFGARGSNSKSYALHKQTDSFRRDYGSDKFSVGSIIDGKNKISGTMLDLTINGTHYAFSTQFTDIPYSIYLYELNTSGIPQVDYTNKEDKITKFRLYIENEWKLNFTPCISPSGEYGMYDSVSKKFFGNANTVGRFDGKIKAKDITYGIEYDTTKNSAICTRVGNLDLHRTLPIQNGFMGCVHKRGVVQYYLHPDDWSKKIDGTPSKLDGTDGNVGVDIGREFYGRSFMEGTKRRIMISTEQVDSTWIKVPRIIIDAYRPTVDMTTSSTPKMASVVNTTAQFRGGGNRSSFDAYLSTDPFRSDLGKPRTNISRATMRIYAFNAGGILAPYQYYKWLLYWLYVIEYANFNCQAAYNPNLTSEGFRQGGLGDGISTWQNDAKTWSGYNGTYPITPCGFTNSLGNRTGIKALVIPAFTATDGTTAGPSKTFNVPRWHGIELPCTDVWTNMDQTIIQNDQTEKDASGNCLYKNVYTLKNPERLFDISTRAELDALKLDTLPNDNYELIGREIASDGCTREWLIGDTAEIIPIQMGGGSTTYKCDYHWQGDKVNTATRTLLFGGGAHSGSYAGLGVFDSYDGVGYAWAHIGFRGLYKYKNK